MNSKKAPKLKGNKTSAADDVSTNVSETLSLEDLVGAAKLGAQKPDGSIDDSRQKLTDQRLRERETERRGVEKYYELRDKWSRYIRDYVWATIAFQFIVTVAVGCGWVDFIKYQFLVTLVVGQNFAQIVGMGIIVAKYLFSDPKKGH